MPEVFEKPEDAAVALAKAGKERYCVCGGVADGDLWSCAGGTKGRCNGFFHARCAGLLCQPGLDARCPFCADEKASNVSALFPTAQKRYEETHGILLNEDQRRRRKKKHGLRDRVVSFVEESLSEEERHRFGMVICDAANSHWPAIILDPRFVVASEVLGSYTSHGPPKRDLVLYLGEVPSLCFGWVARRSVKPYDPAKIGSSRKADLKKLRRARDIAESQLRSIPDPQVRVRRAMVLANIEIWNDEDDDEELPQEDDDPDAAYSMPLVGRLLLQEGSTAFRVVKVDKDVATIVRAFRDRELGIPEKTLDTRIISLAEARRGVATMVLSEPPVANKRIHMVYQTPRCGKCKNCLDKAEFGGTNSNKQACILQLQERKDRLLLQSQDHRVVTAIASSQRKITTAEFNSVVSVSSSSQDKTPGGKCSASSKKRSRYWSQFDVESRVTDGSNLGTVTAAVSASGWIYVRWDDAVADCAVRPARLTLLSGPPSHDFCAICQSDLANGSAHTLIPCGHKFHPACIDGHIRYSDNTQSTRRGARVTCPICRAPSQVNTAHLF